MEHQIVLLPSKGYWDWVGACQEYVKHYGPNLTQDPGTAARYMAPAQVITFPLAPGAYPDQGDLEDWFEKNYPGIRLDPIDAKDPKTLASELYLRIEQGDRYGQKRRPFYLLWPTDYAVVTQKFGVNPHIYSRFGMPGHEGVDIRALTNTNVYCCADGEVYLVHTNPKSHAYGIHVRIRHKDGYKTIYGHLAQPLVKMDEKVSAGQVIGKANSTGASTGAHLHLTLKRDGASERGETKYPKDVIDPTQFLVWPERSRKSMPKTAWSQAKCLVGYHPRVGGRLTEPDFNLLAELRPEALMLPSDEDPESIIRLQALNPELFIMGSLTVDFASEAILPEQFLLAVRSGLRHMYDRGVRYFEVGSNPNLQSEGYGRSWRDGFEFARWFNSVIDAFKSEFQEARFGFPGLSPGDEISGWRAEPTKFIQDAEVAIDHSDWIGVHAYWVDAFGMHSPSGGRVFEAYQHRFPGKLLFITEFNNPSQALTSTQRAGQYLEFLRSVRDEAGIGAAFAYAISSQDDRLEFPLNRAGESDNKWIAVLNQAL